MNKTAMILCILLGLALVLFPERSAEAQGEQASGSENTVQRQIPVQATQGVAVDENYFYAISNTKIVKYDKKKAHEIATWNADKKKKEYEHFTHMNSGTVIEGKLYCAHSQYWVDPNDNTVEIWNIEGEALTHEKTIPMPREHGSLVWIDRRSDGSWWMCYAVYGKNKNKDTRLVRYHYKNKKFIEVDKWVFPKQVVANWKTWSCSGGSWGPDGFLYVTGHDGACVYVLEFDSDNQLRYVRTEKDVGIDGQAIAWDRFSARPILWGIIKNKKVSLTLIPKKKDEQRNQPGR